jgi:hypothetical protein
MTTSLLRIVMMLAAVFVCHGGAVRRSTLA